jgi:SulP family sulfate permease
VAASDGPVRWLLLNVESNVEIDSTAVAALEELRLQMADRGVLLALARVKQDLAVQLARGGFLQRIGTERVFPTLPTALEGYREWAEQLPLD